MSKFIILLAAFCFVAGLGSTITVSAQVLSPLYTFDDDTNDQNRVAGLLLSGGTLYGTAFGSAYDGGGRSINLSFANTDDHARHGLFDFTLAG
jgi:hypothetical protein